MEQQKWAFPVDTHGAAIYYYLGCWHGTQWTALFGSLWPVARGLVSALSQLSVEELPVVCRLHLGGTPLCVQR
jgi:hypothetical protein